MGYLVLHKTPKLIHKNKEYKHNIINIIASGCSLHNLTNNEWNYINNSRINIGLNKTYFMFAKNWKLNKTLLDTNKLNYICFYDISFMVDILSKFWEHTKFPSHFVTLEETLQVSELRLNRSLLSTVNYYYKYHKNRSNAIVLAGTELYYKNYIGYSESMTSLQLAINFALFLIYELKDIDEINLWGVDFEGRHYNGNVYRGGRFTTWQNQLQKVAEIIKNLPIRIINRNINSNLLCFKKDNLWLI